MLDAFFMSNGFVRSVEVLGINKAQSTITGREFGALTITVLPYPTRQRVGYADIERPVLLTGEKINPHRDIPAPSSRAKRSADPGPIPERCQMHAPALKIARTPEWIPDQRGFAACPG